MLVCVCVIYTYISQHYTNTSQIRVKTMEAPPLLHRDWPDFDLPAGRSYSHFYPKQRRRKKNVQKPPTS